MGASPVLARMAQILGFAMEMTRRRGPWRLQMRNPSFSPTLGNPHTTRVSTFPQRRLRLSPICIGEKLAKIVALVRFLHRTEKRSFRFLTRKMIDEAGPRVVPVITALGDSERFLLGWASFTSTADGSL